MLPAADATTHLTEAPHPHELVDASVVEVVDKLRHLRHVLNGHGRLLWRVLYLHMKMISDSIHSFFHGPCDVREVQRYQCKTHPHRDDALYPTVSGMFTSFTKQLTSCQMVDF